MSASELADALSDTRKAAIKAMGSRYIRGADEPDDAACYAEFHAMGIDDDFGIEFLLHGWKILRESKADAPTENGTQPAPASEAVATKAQLDYLDSLLKEKGIQRDPEYPFTKPEASKAIEEVKAGTYDPKRYELPF